MGTVSDLLQNNPEIASALPPQPTETAPDPNTTEVGGTLGAGSTAAPFISSWAQARKGRSNQQLASGGFQDLLAQHHATVADTEATAHAAEALFSLHNVAQSQQETGEVLKGLHGLRADDPNYENIFLQSAIDYPHADWKRIHEAVAPLHADRQAYMATQRAIQGEADGAKALDGIQKAVQTGNLHVSEFPKDQNGMPVHPSAWDPETRQRALMLAASRESGETPGGAPKLTPEEEYAWKASQTNPNFKQQILGAEDDATKKNYNPASAMMKQLFYRAQRKIGGAPATQQSAANDGSVVFREQ